VALADVLAELAPSTGCDGAVDTVGDGRHPGATSMPKTA
jgi:hypothetical protein